MHVPWYAPLLPCAVAAQNAFCPLKTVHKMLPLHTPPSPGQLFGFWTKEEHCSAEARASAVAATASASRAMIGGQPTRRGGQTTGQRHTRETAHTLERDAWQAHPHRECNYVC